MKFSDHLETYMTPEWRKQYITYRSLRSMLYVGMSLGSSDEEHPNYKRHLRALQEEFFQTCDRELAKVNRFYSEKLFEAQGKLTSLRLMIGALQERQRAEQVSSVWKLGTLFQAIRVTGERQTKRQFKLALSELYYSLVLLQNYQELNSMGFCKIMKKHDERFTSKRGMKWKNETLDTSVLQRCRKTCQFMSETESLMCQLTGGDRQKAERKLQVRPTEGTKPVPGWTMFRLGLTCGLLLALLVLIMQRMTQVSEWEPLRPLLRLYRGGFLLAELFLLLGLNVYGWQKAGVNYVLIFELDRRDVLSHYHLFEVAGYLAVYWSASVLAGLYAHLVPVPLQLQPLLFYCLPLMVLLNPVPAFHARARRWLVSLLCRVLTAPVHPVAFVDCWLAEIMNSLSPLFLDLWYLVCFYTCEVDWKDLSSMSAPPVGNLDCERFSKDLSCLIQCFPPWLRLAQCLRSFWNTRKATPHLVNAAKYASVIITVTFAGLYNMALAYPSKAVQIKPYLYLWATSTCMSVLATVSWDLRMDWGLLQGPGLLRKEAVYSRQAYYHCAMLADVSLRLTWGVNIILVQMRDTHSSAVAAVLAPLEVIRRFIWNFFKLENEHLRNCGQFRAVRDILVNPQPLNECSSQEGNVEQDDEDIKETNCTNKACFLFHMD